MRTVAYITLAAGVIGGAVVVYRRRHPNNSAASGPPASDPPASDPPASTDKQIIISAEAAECTEIIKTETLQKKGLKNDLTQWQSRALPNKRLEVAFGIDNCFMTLDRLQCKNFRDKVEDLQFLDDDRWAALAVYAREVVRDDLPHLTVSGNLFTIIQKLTMKTVLQPLFDLNAHNKESDS